MKEDVTHVLRRVSVADGSGVPVAGARVSVEMADPPTAWSGVTSASGEWVPPETISVRAISRVLVAAPGYARRLFGRKFSDRIDRRSGLMQVWLAEGATSVVKVSDQEGFPIAEHPVSLTIDQDVAPPGTIGRHVEFTNAEGVAEFEGIEPGEWGARSLAWKDWALSNWALADAGIEPGYATLTLDKAWEDSEYAAGIVVLESFSSSGGMVSNYHLADPSRMNRTFRLYDEGGLAAFYVPCGGEDTRVVVCREREGGPMFDREAISAPFTLRPGARGMELNPRWE